ncbi:transporter [Catalinimonas alkaloidigena]|uniref:transporter n=1 Tax=Catalinimonas alkaloidigena TaxID=1075417 RepID=UPI002404F12B|nr:transporter [Catalinimonas alkaloidigena]
MISGFNQGQGKGTIAVSYAWESYDEFYFGDEKMAAPPPYGGQITTQSLTLYTVYGLTDHLDIILNLPYIAAKGKGDDPMVNQDVSDLQDATLFLNWNPIQIESESGMLSFVGALGISTPLSDYEANAVLSIGNQSTRIDPKILIQYQSNDGWFANLNAGYSVRTKDVPNATVLGAKLGFAAAEFYVDLWSETQISDSDAPDIGGVPFNETRVNYTQIGLNAYYPFSEAFGISLGYGKNVSGRNVGLADRVSGGLLVNF